MSSFQRRLFRLADAAGCRDQQAHQLSDAGYLLTEFVRARAVVLHLVSVVAGHLERAAIRADVHRRSRARCPLLRLDVAVSV